MRFLLVLLFAVVSTAATPASHPRLYVNAARVAQLREEIATFRKPHWEMLRAQADALVKKGAPDYAKQTARGNDAEQLWMREVGNAMPTLAMAWLLTRDEKYRAAAEAFALASCSYPTWGGPKYDGKDLSAGHQLFGLAMVYDWLYADLSPEARTKIHEGMLVHGRVMFAATDPKTGMYWRESYLQNHLWVNATGLAAAALAIPEEPETAKWLEVARDKFRKTEDALGPDGASQEGVAYWTYGAEYLLKFWALSADLLGEDLKSPWWKQTALYRLYLGLPQKSVAPRNSIVDIADGPRSDYYGPDYILFNLARRFGDGHAQWLALELEKVNALSESAPFLNLLWFDPKVQAKGPGDLPTLRHFEDMGIVSARSDWSGDEALVVFKSSPPAGHEEAKRKSVRDPGYGHVHPDANHFIVFADGKWMIQDDGYGWKQTGQHNTLLVDGLGQTGEGGMWFQRKGPVDDATAARITEVKSTAEYDVMVGDAAGAYLPDAGVRKFVRKVVFWKAARAVLVMDEVETDKEREMELRFHPVEGSGVRVVGLTPAGVREERGMVEGKDRHGSGSSQYTVRMMKKGSNWRNVVAVEWGAEVKMTGDGVFECAGKKLVVKR